MFILNKNDEIFNELIKKIKDFDEIFISVSFITGKALKEIFKNVNILNKKIKVITTTDDYITDIDALNFLFENKIETKIINHSKNIRSFHAKFILFKKNNFYTLFNGSLNFTYNSFFNKYEAINIIEGNDNKIFDEFNYLWNIGIELNFDYIKKYKSSYIEYKSLYNEFINKFKLNPINIEPNKMQIKVLNDLKKLRELNKKTALLWSATGTGKTFLSAFDFKASNSKKLLFIVHNRTIISTAKKDYENLLSNKKIIEIFTKNFKQIKENDIIFTTEKTIDKIKNKKPEEWICFSKMFDYIIFDEAHKIGEKKVNQMNIQATLLKYFKENTNAFILGMTATPLRTDNPDYVLSQFNNIVGKMGIEDSIKQKLITKYNYYGIDTDTNFNLKEINNNKILDMVDKFLIELKKHKIWNNGKIKGIVFTKTIREADQVAKLLTEKGYESISIHSKKKLELKEEIYIENVQNDDKNLIFLVIVNKYNEGVDIPLINTICMFRFTESNIIYSQQIGRGLRRNGEDKKYLNIFDMIGNNANNFERIISLSGKYALNPRELLKIIYLNKNEINSNKNKIYYDFYLSKISSDKINLKLYSYKKYFNDKIKFELTLNSKVIKLSEIEELFEESIQIISNNFREFNTFNENNKSWISLFFKNSGWNIDELTKDEHALIELFSWMPFTVSTSFEKQEILNLLKNKPANLSIKWISYFLGKNFIDKTISQIVRGDFSKYFLIDKLKIFYNKSNKTSKLFDKIINEIIIYLEKYKFRDDKMIPGNWYSKVEVGFMAGYTSSVTKAQFNKYKSEKSFDNNDLFLTNFIDSNKNDKTYFNKYENEILSNNKFILCLNNQNILLNEIKVHNFLGKDLFYNRKTLYKYIGLPNEKIFKDTMENKRKSRKNGKNFYSNSSNKYYRYFYFTNFKLSEYDLEYFKY